MVTQKVQRTRTLMDSLLEATPLYFDATNGNVREQINH